MKIILFSYPAGVSTTDRLIISCASLIDISSNTGAEYIDLITCLHSSDIVSICKIIFLYTSPESSELK